MVTLQYDYCFWSSLYYSKNVILSSYFCLLSSMNSGKLSLWICNGLKWCLCKADEQREGRMGYWWRAGEWGKCNCFLRTVSGNIKSALYINNFWKYNTMYIIIWSPLFSSEVSACKKRGCKSEWQQWLVGHLSVTRRAPVCDKNSKMENAWSPSWFTALILDDLYSDSDKKFAVIT